MDEIALVIIKKSQFPANPAALKNILISRGMNGSYRVEEENLHLQNEAGTYEFQLFEEDATIEIFGDFKDIAASIIELQEIFTDAFAGATFSTAYDDDFEEDLF